MEQRIKELNKILKEASRVYYQEDREIMSNYEYDLLYDELLRLEAETGFILPDSITQNVGPEAVTTLKKVRHEQDALSLDKTKSVDDLVLWLGDKTGDLSWKLDGLTVVCTYKNGRLKLVATRGNGTIGEDVTHNAKYFSGLPSKISYNGDLVVRGEALITYSEFERINEDLEEKYKNPRNLASGTVRALDSNVPKERKITVKMFELVSGYPGGKNLFSEKMEWLKSLGFDIVEYESVNGITLPAAIEKFKEKIQNNDFPSDGLVLTYEDVDYGISLGKTGKFPRSSIAFKWQDEIKETKLKEVFWSASRTGLINPVAVFEPIELEGTTVQRASASNVSIAKALKLSPGSVISVYKANMIIPTIYKNVEPAGELMVPKKCPVCGADTEIHVSSDNIETLHCTNPACLAKHVGMFERFCSRDAMNIVGLSEATFEKFINQKFLKEIPDIFHLNEFKEEIIALDGFGEKSFKNIMKNIEKSRNTTLSRFIYALGIPNIGKDASKKISRYVKGDFSEFEKLCVNNFDFRQIEDFGDVMNDSMHEFSKLYYSEEETWYDRLKREILFESEFKEEITENSITGKTFVVTGALNTYENRDVLKVLIESMGGKVSGSVSKKTDYLINNDVTSTSGKNKKAKELGIPIITENEFNAMIKGE